VDWNSLPKPFAVWGNEGQYSPAVDVSQRTAGVWDSLIKYKLGYASDSLKIVFLG